MLVSTNDYYVMRQMAEVFCDILEEDDDTRQRVIAFVGWLHHWGIDFMATREDAIDRILGTESTEKA